MTGDRPAEDGAAGRWCVVTGGSRGIGRAFVAEAARRGYHVAFTHRGRGTDARDTMARAAGTDVRGFVVDLTDPGAVAAFAEEVLALGPVRILVNNAGTMAHGTLAETTEEGWRRSFAVHVDAPMLLTRAFAVSLRDSGGAVLNVTSTGGVVGSLHGVSYGASKAAIIGLTKTLARELAPEVRVNALAPGPVATDMYAALPEDERRAIEEETPLGRVGTPDEIARVGMDICHWTYVTGQTIVADGGRVMV